MAAAINCIGANCTPALSQYWLIANQTAIGAATGAALGAIASFSIMRNSRSESFVVSYFKGMATAADEAGISPVAFGAIACGLHWCVMAMLPKTT